MQFEEMKNVLADAAARAGIGEYEIYYQSTEDLSAETLKDEISSFSSGKVCGVSFRCIVNGKQGYASSQLLDRDTLEELVYAACANAACIDSEDEPYIFEGSSHYASLDGEAPALLPADEIRDAALLSMRHTYASCDLVADGTQCGAVSSVRDTYLYNSRGLSLSSQVGMSGVYASAIVRDGEDAAEVFDFCTETSAEEIEKMSRRAVERAKAKLGGGTLPSGKYGVLFDGRVFREFLSAFSPIFSAKNARQGLSLLAGKEGERIAASHLSLIDDPMREGNPMKASFDGEGVATQKRAVIDHGVLTTLLYDLTTARRAGKESTGNGRRGSYSSPVSISPYNFYLAPGDAAREELQASLGDGIFVTEAKGLHAGADATTGDFSIECAGFLVKEGKLSRPVKSFTVAGNFYELLMAVEALGNEVHWGIPATTAFGSPDVLLRNVSVAG